MVTGKEIVLKQKDEIHWQIVMSVNLTSYYTANSILHLLDIPYQNYLLSPRPGTFPSSCNAMFQ